MWHKIIKKITFVLRIAALGSDVTSKFILLREALRIQKNFYTKGASRRFQCWIGCGSRRACVSFRGTLDELHALTEIFIEHCYDPHVKNIRKALDLGANIGLASIWIWLTFPECNVDAYEPDPETYMTLEKNLSPLAGARTFNVAIADKNGTMKFNKANRSFSSSFYLVTSSKMTAITVPTKTIDQAIFDIGGSVDLMKIDIEGAEFAALEQSRNLNQVHIIIGEVHPEKAGKDIKIFTDKLLKTHRINKGIKSGKSLFYAERFL